LWDTVPSRSPERPVAVLDEAERRELIAIAREAVRQGLERAGATGTPVDVSARLRDPGASFVTLRRRDELLGCIGTMEPIRPLAEDVHFNASGAAFADPRLPAVTWDDFEELSIKVSVLGPLEPVDAMDRDDLAQVVRPRVDGLIVATRRTRGTFLPSVWDQVPDVDQFLDLLWDKARVPRRSWPADLVVQRYETVEFGD
jgi:AmmeMemoRadiSam system protein A